MSEETQQAVPARFRKTKNDTWAVMAPVSALEKALSEGGQIDVQKKSGAWSTFVVGSLGRPFDVDGVQMCYGYPPETDGEESGGGTRQATAERGRQSNSQPMNSPRPSPKKKTNPPPIDPNEPLPEFQGGPEDEWTDGF